MVNLLPRIRDIRRIGSSALDLCHVGEGAVDAYVEEGVNYWDHAAGAWWPGSRGPHRADPGAGGLDLMICAPAHGFDEFRDAVRDAGFLAETGPVSGNSVPSDVHGHDGEPVCAVAHRWCTIWRAGRRSGKGSGCRGTGK